MTNIGPYNILDELGRGGMGVVYRAEDPGIRRIVAIKTIHLDRFADTAGASTLRERFLREARSAGSLSHPGIVTVYQLGEHQGQPYIVMEYIDGGSLERYMPGAPNVADPKDLLQGLTVVASALDYAHRHNVIHRDIKPGNILVSRHGAFKIADFGLAKIIRDSAHSTTSGLIGTPLYFAPEQLRGSTGSPRSDQYALGVIVYHIVTNRLPYSAKSTEELLFQIIALPPPKASSLNQDLDSGVDEVLDRVLHKDPSRRYGSCEEFMVALNEAIGSMANAKAAPKAAPPPARPGPPPPPPSGLVRNKAAQSGWKMPQLASLIAVSVACILVGLAVFVTFLIHGGTRADPVSIIRLASTQAPYVSDLPPPVESTGYPQIPVDPSTVTGPHSPRIIWRAVGDGYIPVYLAGIGGDGTIYLRDSNHLWGIRDGRMHWGYEFDLRGDPRPHMSVDSRVWLASGIMFNRDGKGGLLRGEFHPPISLKMTSYEPDDDAQSFPRFQCVKGISSPPDWHARGPGIEGYDDQGMRWFLPLDHDCEKYQVTRNGSLFVTTAAKTLYRLNFSGQVIWICHAACTRPALKSLSNGDVVVFCAGEPVQYLHDGRLLWTFAEGRLRQDTHGHAEVPGVEVDQAGTSYFSTWDTETPCQFYAVDSTGKLKWKIKLGDIHVDGLHFDQEGRIYVSGDGVNGQTRGSGILCLADSDGHPGAPKKPSALSICVDSKLQAKKLIKKVWPKYSGSAIGSVSFEIAIGEDGHVRQMHTIDGFIGNSSKFREALSQWVYEPTIIDGRPVEVVTTVEVNYR
jgi:serine/threonine protein kinase/outer membrane protein assembly factor BamB